MKRLSPAKFLATAAVALGALGAVTAAQARSDVFFSIGVQAPGVYVEPAPVYVQPQPVYVQPRPVYTEPIYSAQPQVYVNPAWTGYGPSYDDDRRWRQAEWRRRQWERHHRWDERHSRGRHWD
ncbi:MAG: PXPV repeat protein [Ramlibacter sp.]